VNHFFSKTYDRYKLATPRFADQRSALVDKS